ncbi:carbon-nitrogen hydrolase family protein [Actinomadura sp. WAC 06369]|uniref:carbon-nitrogen hydrolase family protein n=1 Tax=Actinomadura sp. WAC 06369 TaxID=2203193 RepID=UPI000F79F21A|nr:carbon-nitrogen hydrolase family protein [Actinomadura sp. WAC 06369]RSN72100.1 nitrilase [Actinomadura sp. WAC 06369]
MGGRTAGTGPGPDSNEETAPALRHGDDSEHRSPPEHRRYLWLGLGLFFQLFAVGGRWDLTLFAWVFQIFLLRFLRTSRPQVGLPLVWLVGVAGGLFWAVQLAVPLTFLTFVGVLSLASGGLVPFAVDRFVSTRLRSLGRLLAFPAALTATSFLVGTFNPFGTAYGLPAVTQHTNLALLQVLAVAGPYAIGFLIGGVATAVNHLWERGLTRHAARPALAAAAVLAVVVIGGQARLAFAPAPTSPTVRIAGINPDMAVNAEAARLAGTDLDDFEAVSRTADPAAMRAGTDVIADQLFADTRLAARTGAKIVFWSENAARLLSSDVPAFQAEAVELARQEGIYLNMAMNIYLPDPPYVRDQTVLVGPDGNVLWTYEKHHPIPGLEPNTPGEGPVPVVETPYGRLSNVICYDADFPAMMKVDADIMLVPGGDWPEIGRIHTRMASLRAIENGYTLVRQDFNGSSQAFDYQGHVLSQQDTTPDDTPFWIVDVPTNGTTTVYRVVGDVFAWLCAAATLITLGCAVRISRTQRLNTRKRTHETT